MSRIHTHVAGIIVLTMLGILPAWAQAPVAPTFTYQGQLNELGNPVTGTVDFRFSLWDAATEGGQLGVAYLPPGGVVLVDGLFTVEVDAASFGSAAFTGEARWLEIEVYDAVAGWVTLSPRQPLTPAPYALYALDSAGSGGGDCLWELSGSDIYYNAGNVGVGNSSPSAKLDVLASGEDPAIFAENGDAGTSATLAGTGAGVSGSTSNPDGAGVYGSSWAGAGVWGHNGNPDGYAGLFTGRGYFTDEVGIGRIPTTKLDVAGTVRMDGFQLTDTPVSGYVLTADETGVGTWQPGGGGSLWTLDAEGINYQTGNVGIGADSDTYARLNVDSSGQQTIHAHNGHASAQTFALYAEADSTLARTVFADATATSGQTVGVFGRSASPDGYGILGDATSSTGAAIGVYGRSDAEDGYGGYFEVNGGQGYGVYAEAASGVTGYAGYFVGRGYFSSKVGIGTASPNSPLTVSGIVESLSGGFKFPDGTIQMTAGGGGGDSVWLASASGICYSDGDVGIGTDNPDGQLHVVNPISHAVIGECLGEGMYGALGHEFAGVYGVGSVAVLGESHDTIGKGVHGYADSSSGQAVGVFGQSQSPDGFGVWGYNDADAGYNNAIGVFGSSNNENGVGVKGHLSGSGGRAIWGQADGSDGWAVYAEASASSGDTYGVNAYVASPDGKAVYGFNEADSGDAIGIQGDSASPAGIGVKGSSDWVGVLGKTWAATGRGVVGESFHADGFAGYFLGKGYFSGNVGIGTEDPWGPLHVVHDGSTAVIGQNTSGSGSLGYLGESGMGVYGEGPTGVYGLGDDIGVEGYGVTYGLYGNGEYGVYGEGTHGVYGYSTASIGVGVKGESTGASGHGVIGIAQSADGIGVFANATGGGVGLEARGASAAAALYGNVRIYDHTTSALVIELGMGLDYAEGFDVSDDAPLGPGTVLVIDPANPGQLTMSTQAYDRKVAGIVAGAHGLGSGVRLGGTEFDHDVALAGRVYCNVDATESAIQPGDLLTTSATPGHAMKVTDLRRAQGAILGKAMQQLEKGEKGQILVLVALQ